MNLSFLAKAALCPVLLRKMLFVVGRALRREGYSVLQRALFRSISMGNTIDQSEWQKHSPLECQIEDGKQFLDPLEPLHLEFESR